jgi:hypothetical protein
MMKSKRTSLLIAFALVCILSLSGCEDSFGADNDAANVQSNPGSSEGMKFFTKPKRGDTSLFIMNGVECLADYSSPLAFDAIYVSPDGDDTHTGASANDPLGTLAFALCNLRPGQTLNLLPGVYHESVVMALFGGPNQPITIHGVMEDGQRPILDGEMTRAMGIAVAESDNFIIENIEFRNYTDFGLIVFLGSDHIVRNNLFIDNGRAAIDPANQHEGYGLSILGVKNVLIENNEASGNGPDEARQKKYDALGTGIDTYEMDHAIIRGNSMHDNTGGGLLVEDCVDVLVEDNIVTGNQLDANGDWWDGAIWVDGGKDITIRRNRIAGNHGPGLQLSDEDDQYPDASYGYLIEENIITDNLFGVYNWNFGVCPITDETIIRYTNNQVENNTNLQFWCEE